MDCNKACKEIFSHLFTNYLYKQVPSFMISLEEDCLYQFGMIPKDNLGPEICEKLLTNIRLKGPTGQKHEIRTKPYGNAIFLAKGWSDFISCYSLKSSDVLVFFYEGNNIFRVDIFFKNSSDMTEPRGGCHPTEQVGSQGTKGKGKKIAEDEASSGPELKSGRIEQKNIITRNVANAGDGPSGRCVGNQKDASVEFSLARSSTEIGQNNEVSYSTWEESRSSDSVHEIVARPPLQKKVISISSGSFHGNGDEVNGQCSQNLRANKELDNSENSDSDQVTTRKALEYRFVSGQKPITTKETRPIARQLAARFTSQNPYFSKKIAESNVRTICCLKVLVKFGKENFPPKHSKVTLRLPQGRRRWSVRCRYSSQKSQWFFGKGWLAFTRDNNIEAGDWCVFELTCKKKQTMKVHIFREDSYNDKREN